MTEQANIKLIPFKAKKHRHLMPFKKGEGISLAGWQFKIRGVQANGVMNLKCMGKILDDEPAAASIATPQASAQEAYQSNAKRGGGAHAKKEKE